MSESKNMGIGPIGNPQTTFVRKFRWTLECYDFCNDDKITLHEHWFTILSYGNSPNTFRKTRIPVPAATREQMVRKSSISRLCRPSHRSSLSLFSGS